MKALGGGEEGGEEVKEVGGGRAIDVEDSGAG